ncbi:MAG: hypothetical protein PHW64_01235 [Sulfuricurvum sp.]|nr:hypothetical protein [Sulfuricurvum sp.]
MLSKWLIIVIATVLGLGGWILFHPSYQKSIESRFFYTLGHYDQAYALAKESFELDPYNRMASTIMAQSQIALKYVYYNAQAEKYKKEIRRIAAQKNVTPQERAKIKMISTIMVDSYSKIAPSVITDEGLVANAAENYKQFKMLHDELTSPK